MAYTMQNQMMMQQMMQQQQAPPPIQWMNKPGSVPGCPPGLEYLTQIDQILVHQIIELFEIFTSFETANRYAIKNSMGQQVYFAFEESGMCMRQCCHNQRGFIMHIVDNANQEVMRIERDFKCCGGHNCCACLGACAMTLRVESPPGTLIGSVQQKLSCCSPTFSVLDSQENEILQIVGPACMLCPQFCDIEFEVLSVDGDKVGVIRKQFSGLVQEMYTRADNFGIQFPQDLSVAAKATLVGAVFLIDFMYFEVQQNRR